MAKALRILLMVLGFLVCACGVLADSSSQPASSNEKKEAAATAGVTKKTATVPAAIKKNLVCYYPFDDKDAKGAVDKSGKNSNGMFKGAKWSPDGKVGGGCLFSSADDYIAIPNNRSMTFTTQFCISVWMNVAKITQNAAPVVSKWASNGSYGYYQIDLTSSSGIKFHACNGGHYIFNFDTPPNLLTPGQWTHIVATFDSSSKVRIYLDGKKAAETASTTAFDKSTAKLFIGRPANVDGSHGFAGMIDEFMLFDRALSEEEVRQLYDAQK
jgi:hypothetical protein